MDPIKILKDIVNINSSQSTKKISEYLGDLLKDFEITRLVHQDRDNLIVKIKSPNPILRPMVFAMHLDTVIGEWFKEAIETEKEIFGLGACDMKAGIACVCSCIIENKFGRDIYLLFSGDEESTGKNSHVLKNYIPPGALIILTEPTSLNLFSKQHSAIAFKAIFEGEKLHAGLTDFEIVKNKSAMYKAAKLCKFLIEFGETSKELASQNIGSIKGGGPSNITSDHVELKFEQRYKPDLDVNNIKDEIVKKIKSLGAEKVEISFIGESLNNKDEQIISSIKGLLKDYKDIEIGNTFRGWSEAGIFKEKGECFIFGPGEMALAHSEKESVKKEEVYAFKEMYKKIIEELK